MTVSHDAMESYREGYRRRRALYAARMEERRKEGYTAAQRGAQVLRDDFGADRVVLFGSMVGGKIDESSDVDLAAWGIDAGSYYRAVGMVQRADTRFVIDLVRAEDAPESLLELVESGYDL